MTNYMVVGQGSMGKRRVRCLLANDVLPDQITVFDTRQDRLLESAEKYGVNVTADYDGVLKQASIRGCLSACRAFFTCTIVWPPRGRENTGFAKSPSRSISMGSTN